MTKKTAILLTGAAIAAGVAASYRKKPFVPGGGRVNRDLSKLHPEFRRRLRKMLAAMRRRGFQPFVWEGKRTPARAKELARKGKGIENSLHIKGLAADVVDKSTAPRYWKGAKGFWKALGEEARRAGLHWGGDFKHKEPDFDHVELRLV